VKKILISAILMSIIFANPVFADTEKDATAAAKKKVSERIEKLKEKIATKEGRLRKEATQEAKRQLGKHHIKGVITQILEDSFQVQTSKLTVLILTDTDTKYVQISGGPKQTISFSDLKVNDRVSVVGIDKKDLEGLAKLVVRHPRQKFLKKRAVFGTLTSIDGNNLIISHIRKSDILWQVKVTDETRIKKVGKNRATLADLKVGDRLVAVGTVDDAGVITAKFLFISPGKFKGIPLSTPSATTATNSAQ